jgi:hypothetical protein
MKRAGFTTVLASNGVEALEAMNQLVPAEDQGNTIASQFNVVLVRRIDMLKP